MKTKEVEIEGKEFIISRIGAKDATFIVTSKLAPVGIGLGSSFSGEGGVAKGVSAIMSLDKESFEEIVNSLFCVIQIRDNGHLFSVIKNGKWMYEDIRDEANIFIPLLKESFQWTFVDFFGSVSRAFPGALTAITGLFDTKA